MNESHETGRSTNPEENKMNGTSASLPEDTTGLGEYSDEQLLTELRSRSSFKTIRDQLISEEYNERQLKGLKQLMYDSYSSDVAANQEEN